MPLNLTADQKSSLEAQHRVERDKRICDRIKAVLLRSEGWEIESIAQALRIHRDTVSRHISDYMTQAKLSPAHGGSESKLDDEQSLELIAHVEEHLYVKVIDICAHVKACYEVSYSVSGMTRWLHAHGFSYKQPKGFPHKADKEQQAAFIEDYHKLKSTLSSDETVLFMDSVHPSQATQLHCGWIRQGQTKPIATTASRTRLNLVGAIDLRDHQVVYDSYDTINSTNIITFLRKVRDTHASNHKTHLILDRAGYHTCQAVRDEAEKLNIKLHYLPPYSPNLNVIERLWKIMNEQVRNNQFFKSTQEFKDAIFHFFDKPIYQIKHILKARINDNFQVLHTAS